MVMVVGNGTDLGNGFVENVVSDKKANCETHGLTTFKHKINKKGEWWVCHECLKEQWRKAQKKKYKKNPTYTKGWQKECREIRKHFSVYLKLMLYISAQLPE